MNINIFKPTQGNIVKNENVDIDEDYVITPSNKTENDNIDSITLLSSLVKDRENVKNNIKRKHEDEGIIERKRRLLAEERVNY